MKIKTGFKSIDEKKYSCPHCDKVIRLSELQKIPYDKKVKWYQLTPSPESACPKCGELVKNTGNNPSFFLLLVYMPILIGNLSDNNIVDNTYLEVLLSIIFIGGYFFLIYFIMSSAKLVKK